MIGIQKQILSICCHFQDCEFYQWGKKKRSKIRKNKKRFIFFKSRNRFICHKNLTDNNGCQITNKKMSHFIFNFLSSFLLLPFLPPLLISFCHLLFTFFPSSSHTFLPPPLVPFYLPVFSTFLSTFSFPILPF